MKRIFFGADGSKPPHQPFWKPWGGGFFLRALAFLGLTAGVMLLVSILPKCGRTADGEIPGEFRDPGSPVATVPVDSIGDYYDNNITDPGEFLPGPGDNYISPVDPGNLITDPEDGSQYASNRLNVMLDSSADDETFRKFAAAFKREYPDAAYKVIYYDPLTKLLQVSVPEGRVEAMIREMPQKISDVQFLPFPEGMMEASMTPDDRIFRYPQLAWYFNPIEAREAWDITTGSQDVVVAIVDTFFDLNHEDLNSGRIYRPFSIPKRNGNVLPPFAPGDAQTQQAAILNHGSFVAGVAVGNGNNGRGSTGIAPGCRLMPVSMGMQFTSMTMLQGMLYAIYQGANVVNISAGLSLGQVAQLLPLQTQFQIANNSGKAEQAVWDYAFNLADARKVTIVWAAGNDNVLTTIDPSKRGKNTIKVSAVGPSLQKSPFSSFGNFPSRGIYESTISAPGESILGPIPGGVYNIQQGTSFSAPIVAGAVALMKSKNKNLTNEQIIKILKQTGAPIRGNNTIGPLIKIRSALNQVP
ncbi:MAG: S8 family serine peptidase [Muribaculaceae bacterium]|nr:S8 family serine peptidase [Muribaculaceae bacterium]